MKRFLKDALAFSISHESWYSDISVKPSEPFPYILVGFYYEDNGTEGEF